jgi:hypothetical protein
VRFHAFFKRVLAGESSGALNLKACKHVWNMSRAGTRTWTPELAIAVLVGDCILVQFTGRKCKGMSSSHLPVSSHRLHHFCVSKTTLADTLMKESALGPSDTV